MISLLILFGHRKNTLRSIRHNFTICPKLLYRWQGAHVLASLSGDQISAINALIVNLYGYEFAFRGLNVKPKGLRLIAPGSLNLVRQLHDPIVA